MGECVGTHPCCLPACLPTCAAQRVANLFEGPQAGSAALLARARLSQPVPQPHHARQLLAFAGQPARMDGWRAAGVRQGSTRAGGGWHVPSSVGT